MAKVTDTWVVVDGPYADAEPGGDEFPTWSVSLCTEDEDGGEDEKVIGHTRSYEAAVAWGRDVAKSRRLAPEKFINEASRA